jgi:hypothetical protein
MPTSNMASRRPNGSRTRKCARRQVFTRLRVGYRRVVGRDRHVHSGRHHGDARNARFGAQSRVRTSGGALQSSLAVVFTVGSTSGTLANNQYVLGLSACISDRAHLHLGPDDIWLYAQLSVPDHLLNPERDASLRRSVLCRPCRPWLRHRSCPSTAWRTMPRIADRGEGFFLVTSSVQTSADAYFTYVAKGGIAQIPSSTISTSYTVVRKGRRVQQRRSTHSGARLPDPEAIPTDAVVVTTVSAHGLVPGTPITVIGWTNGSGVNGNFFVESVPNVNEFTYTPSGSTGVSAHRSGCHLRPAVLDHASPSIRRRCHSDARSAEPRLEHRAVSPRRCSGTNPVKASCGRPVRSSVRTTTLCAWA